MRFYYLKELTIQYKVKSKGPKQEPCGTPKGISKISDCSPFTITCCERPDKYDFSYCSAVPVIPKDISSRRIMISRSTVSKAELQSKRTNTVTCCRFMLCKISLKTLKSAVSVLCCFLYADWNTGYKSLSSKS